MITSPQDIPIPEDLKKAVENAQNILTLAQVDTNRLNKLKLQLEKEIGILSGNKELADEKLERINTEIKKQEEKLNFAEKSVSLLEIALENIKKEQRSRIKEISLLNKDLADKMADFNTSNENFIREKGNFKSEFDAFALEKENFRIKVEILKEALNKL